MGGGTGWAIYAYLTHIFVRPKVIKNRLTQHTKPTESCACRLKESFMWIASAAHVCFPPERSLFTGEKRGSRVVKICIVQQYATWPKSDFGFDFGLCSCPNLCNTSVHFIILAWLLRRQRDGHLNIVMADLFTKLPSSPCCCCHFPPTCSAICAQTTTGKTFVYAWVTQISMLCFWPPLPPFSGMKSGVSGLALPHLLYYLIANWCLHVRWCLFFRWYTRENIL